MIKFTCPGCQTLHTANDAFAGMRAKCIRCGTTVFVPGGPDDEDDDRSIDELAADWPSSSGPRSRTDRSQWVEDEDNLAGPESGRRDSGDENYDQYAVPDEPAPREPRPPVRRNQSLKAIAALVMLVLIGAGVYYFGFSEKPAPPVKKVAPEPADDEPAGPVVAPVYEFVGPPEPPPPPPIFINAERLNEELARDAVETNARYTGRVMQIQGECERFQSAKLTFRVNSTESKIAAVLPRYLPKFVDEEGRPVVPDAAPAAVGGWIVFAAVPPDVRPVPGLPVAVRGVYRTEGLLSGAELVRLTAPADPLYLGKVLTIVGRVSGAEDDDSAGVTRVTLMKRSSIGLVTVACRLTRSESAALRVTVGDPIALTGKCSGRQNYSVMLDNCTVVRPGGNQLSAVQLADDYEEDLLRYPPIHPTAAPLKVTAEEFVSAYHADAQAANARYEHRVLEITGTVLKLDPAARTVTYESPTDAPIQLRAAFDPADFPMIPPNEKRLTVRTEFRGAARGQKLITLPDCKYHDADATDPTVQRLTADYYPVRVGRQWDVVRVTYPALPPPGPARPRPPDKPGAPPAEPDKPAAPVKARPNPAQRLQYRMKEDGLLLVGQLQLGSFAGPSIFDPAAPPIKWVGKPVKADTAPAKLVEAYRLRASALMVEQGLPTAAADPDAAVVPPDPKDQGLTWHPVLPLNAKAGRSREANLAPGVVLTTTVDSFFRDAAGRDAVKVVSVLTNERAKDARQETVVVYVRGVGEVSRVVTAKDAGRSKVVFEQKLDGEPRDPAEKTPAGPDPAGPAISR